MYNKAGPGLPALASVSTFLPGPIIRLYRRSEQSREMMTAAEHRSSSLFTTALFHNNRLVWVIKDPQTCNKPGQIRADGHHDAGRLPTVIKTATSIENRCNCWVLLIGQLLKMIDNLQKNSTKTMLSKSNRSSFSCDCIANLAHSPRIAYSQLVTDH